MNFIYLHFYTNLFLNMRRSLPSTNPISQDYEYNLPSNDADDGETRTEMPIENEKLKQLSDEPPVFEEINNYLTVLQLLEHSSEKSTL